MVRVRFQASARLAASARDPQTTVTGVDLPRGVVELPGYPRVGDGIEWADTGRHYTVREFFWFVDVPGDRRELPIVVLD